MSVVHHIVFEESDTFQEESNSPFDCPDLSSRGLSDLVRQLFRDYFEAHQDDIPTGGLYECVLKEIEKPLIEECLRATEGNQKKASEILGMNRNTLRKKMTQLDVALDRV